MGDTITEFEKAIQDGEALLTLLESYAPRSQVGLLEMARMTEAIRDMINSVGNGNAISSGPNDHIEVETV